MSTTATATATSTVMILRAVRSRIAKFENWTQGANARNAGGSDVPVNHRYATCWCLVGALALETKTNMLSREQGWRLAKLQYDQILRLLRQIIARLPGMGVGIVGIINYNDTHSHAEVIELLDESIARASEVTQ